MAAALTLGLRGHRVVILEAAPKVRGVLNNILGAKAKMHPFTVDGGWSWNPSLPKHA
jgi:NADPH-dependent 2,4-dienoyl-CoA reductase/sulfur reductase-like enzyme